MSWPVECALSSAARSRAGAGRGSIDCRRHRELADRARGLVPARLLRLLGVAREVQGHGRRVPRLFFDHGRRVGRRPRGDGELPEFAGRGVGLVAVRRRVPREQRHAGRLRALHARGPPKS